MYFVLTDEDRVEVAYLLLRGLPTSMDLERSSNVVLGSALVSMVEACYCCNIDLAGKGSSSCANFSTISANLTTSYACYFFGGK